jgi:hypothetical protein
MTQPDPPPPIPATAAKIRPHWRAGIRHAVSAVVGALSVLPTVVAVGHIPAAGLIAQAVTVGTAVHTVLALPAVEEWLQANLPWLASSTPPNSRPA